MPAKFIILNTKFLVFLNTTKFIILTHVVLAPDRELQQSRPKSDQNQTKIRRKLMEIAPALR